MFAYHSKFQPFVDMLMPAPDRVTPPSPATTVQDYPRLHVRSTEEKLTAILIILSILALIITL